MKEHFQDTQGVTLIELMAAMAIISILAMSIMPLSRMTYKRTKEIELRHNLRIIRSALDKYKKLADERKISVSATSSGYPENLRQLVEGVEATSGIQSVKIKFLRRIPKDPMTEDGEWGLRSYSDEPDSETWGGNDVYDIFTRNDNKALDGSNYKDW